MTGFERNADIVAMATYAPLFAHVEGWQWRPDLIWFDNLHSVRTCSYYVQQLFSSNKGDKVLPINVYPAEEEIFASSVLDGNEVVIKVVNTSPSYKKAEFRLKGVGNGLHKGKMTVFGPSYDDASSQSGLEGDNTLDEPDKYIL